MSGICGQLSRKAAQRGQEHILEARAGHRGGVPQDANLSLPVRQPRKKLPGRGGVSL